MHEQHVRGSRDGELDGRQRGVHGRGQAGGSAAILRLQAVDRAVEVLELRCPQEAVTVPDERVESSLCHARWNQTAGGKQSGKGERGRLLPAHELGRDRVTSPLGWLLERRVGAVSSPRLRARGASGGGLRAARSTGRAGLHAKGWPEWPGDSWVGGTGVAAAIAPR